MKFHSVALAAATALVAFSAQAEVLTFTGTLTTSDPVFARPNSLTTINTTFANAVRYDAFIFGGIEASSYDFRMTAPTGFDTFLLLYAGAFTPASPLTNLVAFNDDFTNIASGSGFTFPLVETGFYTLVMTTYSNTTALGSYITTVTPVPEPATYGLMALGLVGIGSLVRRRTAA